MDNKLKTIFIYEMKKSINQLVHDHADDVSVGPENLSHSSDGFVVDLEVSFYDSDEETNKLYETFIG